MSNAPRRIARAQSDLSHARNQRAILHNSGRAQRDARRTLARVQRHAIAEALRRRDYETVEVI